MNPRRLFVASCIALVTSAFTFIVRGDILQDMGDDFALSQQEKGSLEGAVFLGMAFSMLLGGFICDLLGMRRIMTVAFGCHLIGVLGTIFAPHGAVSFTWLYTAAFLMGCGNGMVETGINPLAATLYPTRKTHYLNILHAWWPGGLILGGLLVKLVRQGIDLGFVYIPGLNLAFPDFVSWQVSLLLILAPCLIYGAMLFGQPFPLTERVESGVSTGDMFKEAIRPMFLIWAFCMLLTAATELGPQKWQESVMTRTAGISGTMILVYTSGLMFVLRHFAGPLAHAISPVGMMTVSAALSAVGLYLLSTATSGPTAFLYATIFGLGIAYFWPTMLGVTAERFPKGGALLLCLMGSVGNLSISQVLPQMGKIYDDNAVEKLQELDPALANTVVSGGAINQDVAKQVNLLGKLTPDQKKAIDPANWLTPDQKAKLAAWKKDNAGRDPAEFLATLDLPADQRLVLGLLLDDKGELSKQREAFDKSWKEDDLSPQQADVRKRLAAIRAEVSALKLLREVEAARLTSTQRSQLAKALEDAGEDEAAKEIQSDKYDPKNLTSKQMGAAQDAVKKLELTEAQKKMQEKRDNIAKAEAHGASLAFQRVAWLPVLLVLIFAGVMLYDRSRGGYRAIHIDEATGNNSNAGH